jgi:hypothetical protein
MESQMQDEAHEGLRKNYRNMMEGAAPSPWRRVLLHIGGVTAVGFGAGTELMLVLTHSGLGIVDATTGSIVAREVEMDEIYNNPYPVYATGIGPLAGERVPLAGLWGGGLRTMTSDGWVVHRVAPEWPADSVVLCSPDYPELDDPSKVVMIAKNLEPPIRALGFSDSGRSLVVANTSILLWSRA